MKTISPISNRIWLFSIFFISQTISFSQVLEHKDRCKSQCNAAGDEKHNTEMIHLKMKDQHIKDSLSNRKLFIFPIRIGIVENSKNKEPIKVSELSIQRTFDILNNAFKPANIQFYVANIDVIDSPLKIEDLSNDFYEVYNDFAAHHDLKDTISLYLFDYDHEFCKRRENSISCGRTGGFSYILSNKTNSLVLSKFDLEDQKIVAHEFGHFFGLYHTFESHQFGKELISGENCSTTGDMICDTPADPGTLYEVYVNYSTCEMISNTDPVEELDYHPIITNFMSYYKPCFMKAFDFTSIQMDVMRTAADSELRKHFQK